MRQCKALGCTEPTPGGDLCIDCQNQTLLDDLVHRPARTQPKEAPSGRSVASVGDTSSGGDNDYWVATISDPKRLEPYQAECEDLIEHFQMSFQEGEAFKALWRKGMGRLGLGKPGDSPLRNSQKVRHFGARMTAMEERQLEAMA